MADLAGGEKPQPLFRGFAQRLPLAPTSFNRIGEWARDSPGELIRKGSPIPKGVPGRWSGIPAGEPSLVQGFRGPPGPLAKRRVSNLEGVHRRRVEAHRGLSAGVRGGGGGRRSRDDPPGAAGIPRHLGKDHGPGGEGHPGVGQQAAAGPPGPGPQQSGPLRRDLSRVATGVPQHVQLRPQRRERHNGYIRRPPGRHPGGVLQLPDGQLRQHLRLVREPGAEDRQRLVGCRRPDGHLVGGLGAGGAVRDAGRHPQHCRRGRRRRNNDLRPRGVKVAGRGASAPP